MKKHRLQFKALLGFSLLTAALIFCTCITVAVQYWNNKMDEYSALAYSYARTAVHFIDGDRVLSYLETGAEDAYYRQVKRFLNAAQKQTDLKYFYVFVPYEEELVYIWDADENQGACPLGFHEGYMDGGREAVERIFRQNPPEEISITRDAVYGYIASAYSPIFNSAGEPVAVVGVDLSVPGIRQTIFRFVLMLVLSVIGVVSFSMELFMLFFKKRIIRPINQLNAAAKEMVGNLEREQAFRTQIHTGDEIEELARTFEHMDGELRDYIKRLSAVTAEKERIGAELSVAAQIQADMLPCIFPAFPERKEFDIYASMHPAKEIGGDFYDFFLVDEDHLALVIADVSGKGVPAALFMVIAKTLIKNRTQSGECPAQILAKVNEQLCEGNEAGLFVTVWLAIFEISTGRGVSANAGHEYPALMRRNGSFELVKNGHSPAVAALEGMRFGQNEFCLAPGDRLFVYTDGVTDAADAADELFGTEHMLASLNQKRALPAAELLRGMKEDIDRFADGAPQFDDVTMLCFDYFGRKGKGREAWNEGAES